jgi:phage gpG-like protein
VGPSYVAGDFAKLHRLAASMEAAAGAFPRLVRLVGEAALEELREGIAAGRDPAGAKWPATTEGKRALGGGMAASWVLSVEGDTARLSTEHEGAGAHQTGKVITPKTKPLLAFQIGERKVFAKRVTLPQRRMHPRSGSLESWAPRLRRVAVDELSAAIGVAP